MKTQNTLPTIVGLSVDFYIDDISDDISLENVSEDFYPTVESIVQKLREQEWFVEGNKTEGTITFHSDYDILVEWKTIDMNFDLEDEIEEYYQNCIINPDSNSYKTIQM